MAVTGSRMADAPRSGAARRATPSLLLLLLLAACTSDAWPSGRVDQPLPALTFDDSCERDVVGTLDDQLCSAHELEQREAVLDPLLDDVLELFDQHGTSGRPALELSQDRWEDYRDSACAAAGLAFEGGTAQGTTEMYCRVTITEQRVRVLQQLSVDLDR
jgi:uncharacterized protein YecT (DUF1311 family)